MKVLLLIVIGCVTLSALLDEASAQVTCPHCVCPPSFSPVCGFRASTMTTRGFPSRCVLECSNKCRKNKYEFVFNGRCGKWKPSTTTTPTPETATPVVVQDYRRAPDVTPKKR